MVVGSATMPEGARWPPPFGFCLPRLLGDKALPPVGAGEKGVGLAGLAFLAHAPSGKGLFVKERSTRGSGGTPWPLGWGIGSLCGWQTPMGAAEAFVGKAGCASLRVGRPRQRGLAYVTPWQRRWIGQERKPERRRDAMTDALSHLNYLC